MAQFVKVASTDEIAPGSSKQIEVDGQQIALFNIDGDYYAIDNTCTHRGGPLAEGSVEGETVTCPWHGGQFNVKTGAVEGPPPAISVTKYNLRVQGNDVEVEV